MDYEKFERNGKVAVLYSPGFGAGWYSWNSEYPGLLFDREIVEAVLANDRQKAAQIALSKYPEAFTGGAEDLQVAWLDKGTAFRVHEYDGSENIQEAHELAWITA